MFEQDSVPPLPVSLAVGHLDNLLPSSHHPETVGEVQPGSFSEKTLAWMVQMPSSSVNSISAWRRTEPIRRPRADSEM